MSLGDGERLGRTLGERLRRGVVGPAVLGSFSALALLGWLETGPVLLPKPGVFDVTELITIDVRRVEQPKSVQEVSELLATTTGPVSIGGGRFSMGGQIGTDGALFLDMRGMNEVLDLDVANKTVVVQAGITWRELIEAIDGDDLSVMIMQSYADFTVGGTLSVNAHGRYMGLGPVVHSVQSVELVLADGTVVQADREKNTELFRSAIGGYGGVGVITKATLSLAENSPLKRTVSRLPVESFMDYFQTLKASEDVVIFNADLYPPAYDELVAIRFSKTTEPVTVLQRLQPKGESSAAEKLMYWWVSEAPLGKAARSEIIDRVRLQSEPVVYRNYEASYDVASLEPISRKHKTYVLQEYFIPVENFDSFVVKMADVFAANEVNVVNVSIRHAIADEETLLTWAPKECFAFVIYYKMKTDEGAWDHAAHWTQQMADEVLSEGGVWYLPYQIHATKKQFEEAYPGHRAFFELKKQVDPSYRFRNRLWDVYLPPTAEYGGVKEDLAQVIRRSLQKRATYLRAPDQTFLTVPEWTVVYSAQETGEFLNTHKPSEFLWFSSIGQFWTTYRSVWAVCRDRYDFNVGYHLMIGVVGASYTVEYATKGVYEFTFGRLFESLGAGPEEQHYAESISDYAAFIHHTPWYDYPFGERRAELFALPFEGSFVRGLERRAVLGLEFTAKEVWASVVAWATASAFEEEASTIEVWVVGNSERLHGVEVLESFNPVNHLISLPRYEPFTEAVKQLTQQGVTLVEVAGAKTISLQVVVPDGADLGGWGPTLHRSPLFTSEKLERVVLEVEISKLGEVLGGLEGAGYEVEHLYDF